MAWATIFLGGMFLKADLRKAFGGVVRAVLARQILLSLAAMAIYIVIFVTLLAAADIWRWTNLKTTIVWVVTFAIVAMFDINRITEDDTFFRKTIRDAVNATVIVVFIAEFYTFSLPTELVLVPFITVVTVLYMFSQSQPESAMVEKLMGWVLTLVGLSFISYGIYQVSQNFREFATFDTGREFAVPIILSLLFLPFIYILSIYVTYEKVFLQLRFAISDRCVRKYAKTQAVLAFRTDLDFLRRWARSMVFSNPDNKEEVRRSIREIKKIKKREKHPPIVPPSEGWSPYAAMEFLRQEGLVTRDYHCAFDEWIASSPYLSVGTGILTDDIAYYVEGDEFAAKRLKLTLDVNNPNDPQASEQKFFAIARTLLQRAVGEELGSSLSDHISSTDNASAIVQDKNIRVTREDWSGGFQGGYSLNLTIEHRVE